MSKLREGQKLIVWDALLGPFKAVIRKEGIVALENICWRGSGNTVANAGYVIFRGCAVKDLPDRFKRADWKYKPLFTMEENE